MKIEKHWQNEAIARKKKMNVAPEKNEKWRRNVENANRRVNANRKKKGDKNPNLIVHSDVWMPMMDKNLSTTEEADAIENEKYSEKNSIIL